MKYYELESIFTFGKHIGKTLEEVYKINPSYVEWCVVNLDHFLLNEEVFDQLIELSPSFQFSQQALNILQTNWDREVEYWEQNYELEYDEPYSDWQRDCFDAMTDGQHGSFDDFSDNGGDWDRMMDGLGY